MHRQHTATLRSSQPHRRPWLLTAGLVALLAVVAFGIWQVSDRRDGTTTTISDQSTAGRNALRAARPASRAQHGAAAATVFVYLVGSAEAATQLNDAIQGGNEILAGLGQPEFAAQVVVVASPEEADHIARATADADAIRASMGLPPVTVLDLRSQ